MTDSDEHAIERLQRRFAELNDEGRYDEVAALFTEDASFARPSAPDKPFVGREQILQSFLARPKGLPRRHLVANPVVTITGPTTATAICYTVLLAESDEGTGTISVGGFRDELERVGDVWKFKSRKGFTDIEPVPFALKGPLPGA